jgi:hypothetical protein
MSSEQARAERYSIYAETLSKRFQMGILAGKQEKPLWVLWKAEKDRQGNFHKRPYTPKNFPASTYKPYQWASLETVLEAFATGNFAGLDIMLLAPFVLLDKDATSCSTEAAHYSYDTKLPTDRARETTYIRIRNGAGSFDK